MEILGIIAIILTILEIGNLSIFKWLKKIIFKRNIEFHKILQSFPLISEHRINNGTKTTDNDFRTIEISEEFTKFLDSKRGDIDKFLAKIEQFDVSKLKFKKKEITSFINNIKRLLISKSLNTTIISTLDLDTKEFNTKIEGKPFEWTAFNYYLVNEIIKDQDNINKLYICKFLKF